jgi:hypothetical protein
LVGGFAGFVVCGLGRVFLRGNDEADHGRVWLGFEFAVCGDRDGV